MTKYIHDHPGGADVLIEAAGVDASEAFDNAGHSEDAFEIMAAYRVGTVKGAKKYAAKPVRVALVAPAPSKKPAGQKGSALPKAALAASAVAAGAVGLYYAGGLPGREMIPAAYLARLPALSSLRGLGGGPRRQGLGFLEGVLAASALTAVAGTLLGKRVMKMMDFHINVLAFPPHVPMAKAPRPEVLQARGWLHPTHYQTLPLTAKVLVAPNVYRLVFALPTPSTVVGLPIGQHVSIAAPVGGKTVSRSYTPVSNNADRGVLELVIKVYPDGALTGGYLADLAVGDEVQFRGPKGAMRYRRNLCRRLGMVAGGTGITPMYQVIRAICEDDRDTTEVSLVYANRTEEDILLRAELEAFARRYPKNLKIHYMLDQPPATGWAYGTGFVNKDVLAERMPAPAADTKVMLCGPPGMVKGATGALVQLGFAQPAATAKMSDQIFVF